MPQGGPGNAGGNLMGPGGSKKGLRGGGRTRHHCACMSWMSRENSSLEPQQSTARQ